MGLCRSKEKGPARRGEYPSVEETHRWRSPSVEEPIGGGAHRWRNPSVEEPIGGGTHRWRNPSVEEPIGGGTHRWRNPSRATARVAATIYVCRFTVVK